MSAGEHLLDRGEEVGGAGHVALGFLLARGDGLVVATLAGDLGVLGEGEESGVEVLGDADGDLAVAGGQRLAGGDQAVASLFDELLRAWAHGSSSPPAPRSSSRSPQRTTLSRSTSWVKKERISRRSRSQSVSKIRSE